jgi:hypothetical protein
MGPKVYIPGAGAGRGRGRGAGGPVRRSGRPCKAVDKSWIPQDSGSDIDDDDDEEDDLVQSQKEKIDKRGGRQRGARNYHNVMLVEAVETVNFLIVQVL